MRSLLWSFLTGDSVCSIAAELGQFNPSRPGVFCVLMAITAPLQ